MTVLSLVQSSNLVDIGGGPGWGTAQVRDDLDNMVNALARHHGRQTATDIMAEAFAQVFARWAVESGRPIPCRFALEVMLGNAFAAESSRSLVSGPPGAA